ncbi:MAG: D-alanine--D-alanine ligase [Actinobacteria bacterium]|jgi:D-alanine-D-alanine ligase|nr:MAG: D-alanine--D-alanine ligase [Actinomycetota bacterium]
MSRIAVLMGGTSAEREVSLRSGAAVSRALRELGHEVLDIDVGAEIVARLAGLRGQADVAFIVLHGRMGEDGTVQGLLELLGIPYTGSGIMASAMTINKYMTKQVFRANAIPVAEDVVVGAAEIAARGVKKVAEGVSLDLGFPCIVKPNCEGSTVGAGRARNREELEEAIDTALAYDDLLVIERYIEGREMTVGLLGDEPIILPVLEVVASKGLYDYECKYTKGMTEYIVPAPITEELERELKRLSLRAHLALDCEGFARIDFMVDAEGNSYCLEANTIPGMTELSLIPKAAAAAGLSFTQVVEIILGTARLKINRDKKCYEG